VGDIIKIVMWISIGGLLGQAFQSTEVIYGTVGLTLFCILSLYLGKVFTKTKRQRQKRSAVKQQAKQAYDDAMTKASVKRISRKKK
jgi:uncharacterized membrane protein YuzA (DUF378 family)